LRKNEPRKYTHPKRDLNKARVLELLKKGWTGGIRQNEIIEKLNLTKPTIHNILNELLSEHKIYKLNNMYYPEFDDDFVFSILRY
jgi:DNA invertase Pin-like site-specific DNA recombinase